MKKLVVLAMCILCFFITSCSNPITETTVSEQATTSITSYPSLSAELNPVNQDAIGVSIIELISNPSEYDGQLVRVIGVGNLEFEGDAVYLAKDDLKYGVTRNGLWLELGKLATPYDIAVGFNGKYVIIEGVFNKNDTGHFGLFSGAIEEISRYELWEDNI